MIIRPGRSLCSFRPPSIGPRNPLLALLLVYPSARPFVCSRIAHCLISSRLVDPTLHSQRSNIKYQISNINHPFLHPPSSIRRSFFFRIISSFFLARAYTHIRPGPLRTLIRVFCKPCRFFLGSTLFYCYVLLLSHEPTHRTNDLFLYLIIIIIILLTFIIRHCHNHHHSLPSSSLSSSLPCSSFALVRVLIVFVFVLL